MHTLLLTAGLCAILVTMASSDKLVCYYNREAATRAPIGAFTPSMIDPNLCTHIIFGFAGVDLQNNLVPAAMTDISLYTELNAHKVTNPSLVTLLAVGGPGFDTQRFSTMVAAPTTRNTFIDSAIKLLEENGFNGLNLDWRYPGDDTSQPTDKTRFTKLCQEIKQRFRTKSLIISASVSADKAMIDSSYEVAAIAQELDFINVLTYGFYGPTASTTAHHSPLGALSSNSGDTLTTDYGMSYWTDLGAPADKLNMGIAAQGVAYTLTNPTTDSGVGAAVTTAAEEGCYGGTPGIWAYYDICLYIQGGIMQWISDQSVPYAVTEGQWVGYDNNESLNAKVAHLKSKGYGGVCVWALDLDDFTGQFCQKDPFPFISHLKSKL